MPTMDLYRVLMVFVVTLMLTLVLLPLVIMLAKRLKMRQTILHYVESHSAKSGTPTMGGLAFIIAASAVPWLFFDGQHTLAVMVIVVFCAYGIIGFLDDFVKIFFRRNQGLNVWQKIISQVLVATLVAMFAYGSNLVGSVLWLPLLNGTIDIGAWIVPFNIFVFLALTNAVNLTDGLDGLASGVSTIYLLVFGAVLLVAMSLHSTIGMSLAEEYANLLVAMAALLGGMVGFLCHNGFPARVFMGDTGALAIGGALGSLAIMTRLTLVVPLIGTIWVASCISVLVQVGYYKLTHRRVFLMAPLHHHYEQKGIHENRIVVAYCTVTLAVGCVVLWLIGAVNALL